MRESPSERRFCDCCGVVDGSQRLLSFINKGVEAGLLDAVLREGRPLVLPGEPRSGEQPDYEEVKHSRSGLWGTSFSVGTSSYIAVSEHQRQRTAVFFFTLHPQRTQRRATGQAGRSTTVQMRGAGRLPSLRSRWILPPG